MNNKILILAILMMGCGLQPVNRFNPWIDTDEEFDMYIEKFEYLSGINVRTPIIFGSLSDSRIGVCYFHSRIEIDRDFWIKSSELSRELLIFHELGHCEMGIIKHEHTQLSVMNEHQMPASIYEKYYDEILDRFFK